MDSDMEESARRKSMKRRFVVPGDSTAHKQSDHVKTRPYSVSGEVKFIQEEDTRLETTRERLNNVLKRHEDLQKRLIRDSDKMIYERLTKEFEAARAAQTEEIKLDDEQWNDGLLATIREKVHMEAERKAMEGKAKAMEGNAKPMEGNPKPVEGNAPISLNSQPRAKTTYRVGNKVICCLEGARIGILYETSFAGEPYEIYHVVLKSKSFLEKMTVIQHTVPFFLPIRDAENDHLSSNAMKFIDYVGAILQGFVDRREQVRLIKELYGNQIRELYHTLSYNMIEFTVDDFDCRVTISLRYADLVLTLPSRIRVLAWPVHPSKKISLTDASGTGSILAQSTPSRLPFAEDLLRTLCLPEAYAEIVLNLPPILQQIFPHLKDD